jgi:hypothetical protein
MHLILEFFVPQGLSRILMDIAIRVFTELHLKQFVLIRSKLSAAALLIITRHISASRPVFLPAFQLCTFINVSIPMQS